MGKQAIDNNVRMAIINKLTDLLSKELGTDVLPVSSSAFSIPTLDEEQNETWVKVSVSVPHGTRDGKGGYIPYDGYAENQAYQETLETNAAKVAKRKADKEMKEAERKRKQDLRKKEKAE